MTSNDHTSLAAAHTAEPWNYGYTPHACNGLPHKVFVDGEEVASCAREANARRIVSAVNACAGIPTQSLHATLLGDLLAALEALLPFAENEEASLYECWKRNGDGEYDKSLTACTAAVVLARAALAKATGRAA